MRRRWEYKIDIAEGLLYTDMINALNFYGGEGWELAYADLTNVGWVAIFKRPLKETEGNPGLCGTTNDADDWRAVEPVMSDG